MKALIRDIIIAIVIVLAITWVIKPTIVKKGSMQPTLYENNYLLVNKQAYAFGQEMRGDIIVFQSNMKDENGKNEFFIKRVIGVPGDTIDIKNEKVYINGKEEDQDYTLEHKTTGDITDLKVPEGKLFVLGDNRRVSMDSRSEKVGCINQDDVMGKAFFRLYPFSEIGRI